jgi:hypothetical protein
MTDDMDAEPVALAETFEVTSAEPDRSITRLPDRENEDYHPNAPHHCQMEDSLRVRSL